MAAAEQAVSLKSTSAAPASSGGSATQGPWTRQAPRLLQANRLPINLTISGLHELESFDYRWPDSTERFDRGFECTATVDADIFEVRHGIGARHVYGRVRAHTVTWIDGQPIVEGVGADDFEASRSLVSAIKGPDGKLVRTEEKLPAGYERHDGGPGLLAL